MGHGVFDTIWHASIINELIAGSVGKLILSSSERTEEIILVSCLGGAAQVLVGQPLDTVKTRAQTAPSKEFSV